MRGCVCVCARTAACTMLVLRALCALARLGVLGAGSGGLVSAVCSTLYSLISEVRGWAVPKLILITPRLV